MLHARQDPPIEEDVYRLDGDTLHATVEVPFGVLGMLDLPTTRESVGTVDDARAREMLGSGTRSVRVTGPSIADGARLRE